MKTKVIALDFTKAEEVFDTIATGIQVMKGQCNRSARFLESNVQHILMTVIGFKDVDKIEKRTILYGFGGSLCIFV